MHDVAGCQPVSSPDRRRRRAGPRRRPPRRPPADRLLRRAAGPRTSLPEGQAGLPVGGRQPAGPRVTGGVRPPRYRTATPRRQARSIVSRSSVAAAGEAQRGGLRHGQLGALLVDVEAEADHGGAGAPPGPGTASARTPQTLRRCARRRRSAPRGRDEHVVGPLERRGERRRRRERVGHATPASSGSHDHEPGRPPGRSSTETARPARGGAAQDAAQPARGRRSWWSAASTRPSGSPARARAAASAFVEPVRERPPPRARARPGRR